jgi:hypothetical protein
VRGQITDGQWLSQLFALRSTPWPSVMGRYTVAMPAGLLQPLNIEQELQGPQGHGAGSMTIDPKGMVNINGNLGDGTPLSFAGGISHLGLWPIYAALQGGKGVCLGWGRLEIDTGDCPYVLVRGKLAWMKSPVPAAKDKFYTNGFAAFVTLTGAPYAPPTNKAPAIAWTQGTAMLQDGNLGTPLSFPVQWVNNKLVVPNNTNQFNFTLTSASGLITGSFRHPDLRKTVSLKGYLVRWPKAECLSEADDFIGGWFLGANRSGSFQLLPLPKPEQALVP